MAFETLLLDRTAGVARITLNRPEAFNALNEAMARDFSDAIAECDADRSVRALVITGAGKAFFAGGDVTGFHGDMDAAPALLKKMTAPYHSALARMTRMKKPVLAAINGVVAGAGMGLAMAADLAIAAESAVFDVAYTRIGASPDGATSFFLPRLVGLRRAMELTLLNRRLTATEAAQWGLINRAVPDGEFEAEVEALAAKLAAGPTAAFWASRRLLYQSFSSTLETQMENEAQSIAGLAGETEDFREGIAAFVEKRKAQFKGC